jgi:tetraacyldisaccharide 4'-kinase
LKPLKIVLFPLAVIYGCIIFIRNLFYDWHILKETKFEKHLIGVGNLAVGGAGKTPLIEYLIRLLKEEGRIATLSRGYKRKTSGFILADENSTSTQIGDEPLLYAIKYPFVKVAVDARRVNGVKQLLKQEAPPSIILLDDVFQHRSIHCGLSIMVSDFNNLYVRDYLMPMGTLREHRSGFLRADVIIITKTPDKITPVEMRAILKDITSKAHQRIFFSYLKYGELYAANNSQETISTLNDLYRYRVIAFTGIANADPMLTYLKEYALDVRHLPFSDHHQYVEKDLEDIERFKNSFNDPQTLLVTTEKDFMRLKEPSIWTFAERMNIFVLPVEVTFKDKEEEFNQLITTYVRTNSIYHQKYS